MCQAALIVCDRQHQRVSHRAAQCLHVAPMVHGCISLRDIIAPHLNQKWKMCGMYGVEETGRCVGKNRDSGVSEQLLPTSAPEAVITCMAAGNAQLSEPQFSDL